MVNFNVNKNSPWTKTPTMVNITSTIRTVEVKISGNLSSTIRLIRMWDNRRWLVPREIYEYQLQISVTHTSSALMELVSKSCVQKVSCSIQRPSLIIPADIQSMSTAKDVPNFVSDLWFVIYCILRLFTALFIDMNFWFRFLEPAQPTEDCPHQYGYFKMGDRQNCGQFMNCADGKGYTFDCPEGLAFNPVSYRCDWPDQVPDCDAEGGYFQNMHITQLFVSYIHESMKCMFLVISHFEKSHTQV